MDRVAVMSYLGNGLIIVVMLITMAMEYRRREINHRKKIQRILSGTDEDVDISFEEIHSGDISDTVVGILIAAIGLFGIGLILYITHFHKGAIIISAFIAIAVLFTLMILRENAKRKRFNRESIANMPINASTQKIFWFKTVLMSSISISFLWFTIFAQPMWFNMLISFLFIVMTGPDDCKRT